MLRGPPTDRKYDVPPRFIPSRGFDTLFLPIKLWARNACFSYANHHEGGRAVFGYPIRRHGCRASHHPRGGTVAGSWEKRRCRTEEKEKIVRRTTYRTYVKEIDVRPPERSLPLSPTQNNLNITNTLHPTTFLLISRGPPIVSASEPHLHLNHFFTQIPKSNTPAQVVPRRSSEFERPPNSGHHRRP